MRRLICATIFLALLIPNLAGAETKYAVTDLGILPGAVMSDAVAVNDKGQVVGICTFDKKVDGKMQPFPQVFLWEKGRMTQIRVPNYKDIMVVTDINDAGQALVLTGKGAYIMESGKFKKIDGIPGYSAVMASAINERGDISGWCQNDKGYWKPSMRRNGVMKALPMPEHTAGIHTVALNNKGQAVCTMKLKGEKYYHAFWENGKMQPIKGIAGEGAVRDIADDGTIVGVQATAGGPRAFVLRGGKLTLLRHPNGFAGAYADSINSKRAVVGRCVSAEDEESAIVWDANGIPTVLDTLGGSQSRAADINDAGVIVGWADDKEGRMHAAMWTPVK